MPGSKIIRNIISISLRANFHVAMNVLLNVSRLTSRLGRPDMASLVKREKIIALHVRDAF